jgi:hypothetical protein
VVAFALELAPNTLIETPALAAVSKTLLVVGTNFA